MKITFTPIILASLVLSLRIGLQASQDSGRQNPAIIDARNKSSPELTLSISNSIWADNSVRFKPAYLDTCRAY